MTSLFETKYAIDKKINNAVKMNSFNSGKETDNVIFSFKEEAEEFIFKRILSTDKAHDLDYSIRKHIAGDKIDNWVMIYHTISTLYAIVNLKNQNNKQTILLVDNLLDSLKENAESLQIPLGFIMNSLYCFLSGINFKSIVIKKICEKDWLDPLFFIKDEKRKDLWNLRREGSEVNLDNIYYVAAFCGDSETLDYLLKKQKINSKKENEILNIETCIDIAFNNEWLTEQRSIKKMTAENMDLIRATFEQNNFPINEQKENQIILNMFKKNYGLSSFVNWNWKYNDSQAIKLLLIKNKLIFKATSEKFEQNYGITNEIQKVFYNKSKDLKDFFGSISDEGYIQCIYAWMLFTIQDVNFVEYKNRYLSQSYCSILQQENEYYKEGVEFVLEILKPLFYIKDLTPGMFDRNKIQILDLFKSTLISALKFDEQDKKEILDNIYSVKNITDEIIEDSIFKTVFIINEIVSKIINENNIEIKNTKKVRL